MPYDFGAIISDHHLPRQKSDPWDMPGLINVSCRMADSVGFAVFQGCELTPYDDLLDELPDRERKAFCSDADVLAFEVSSKINGIESV